MALFQQAFRADEFLRERLLVYLQVALLKYPHPQWQPLQAQLQLTDYQQQRVREYLERAY